MLKVTATQFRKDHQIHFQASIGRTSGIPVELSGKNIRLFEDMDVIDLNGDGKPELRSNESFNRLKLQIKEPVFFTSFDSIESLAEKNETEIVRRQDVRPVKIGEPHYDLAKFIWSGSHKSEVRNERTLDSLVNELGAFPRSAQWAIDVANDQFLIYSAKEQ